MGQTPAVQPFMPLMVQSFVLSPNPVVGPQREVLGNVRLNQPAPPAGEPITVQAGTLIPAITLVIPGGRSFFRFSFSHPPTPQLTQVPVTVTLRGQPTTVSLGAGP
jgi:hypothetical protein